MSENTTTAPVVNTPDSELSDETKRIRSFLKAKEKLPASLTITRNDITCTVTPQPFSRGNLKEAGAVFLGPAKEFYEDVSNMLAYLGEDKAKSILRSAMIQVFSSATEAAISDIGDFTTDVYVKAVQEFSARGEPSSELKDRLKDATERFTELTSSVDFMERLATGQLSADERKELKELRDEMAYCGSTLKSRERKPRE